MNIETTKNIIKLIITGVLSLITIFFFFVIFLNITKSGIQLQISSESIISILLALFSIGISIAFYFKASETSNTFYITSYELMKDQSMLLGRFEERFGERLGNVQSLLQTMKTPVEHGESSEKIQKEVNEIKETVINLTEKAQLSPQEKKEILEEVIKKERSIMELQSKFDNSYKDFYDAINNNNSFNKEIFHLNNIRSENEAVAFNNYLKQIPLRALNNASVKRKIDLSKMSDTRKNEGIRLGFFDNEGKLSDRALYLLQKDNY